MGTHADALVVGRCDAHTWAAGAVAAPPGRAHPPSPAARAQAQPPAQAGRNVVERTLFVAGQESEAPVALRPEDQRVRGLDISWRECRAWHPLPPPPRGPPARVQLCATLCNVPWECQTQRCCRCTGQVGQGAQTPLYSHTHEQHTARVWGDEASALAKRLRCSEPRAAAINPRG